MAGQGMKINQILNLLLYDSWDFLGFPGLQASNFPFPSLPVAFFNSRSLPVKRECYFQFPFPFPGAKKPFPLTPGTDYYVWPGKTYLETQLSMVVVLWWWYEVLYELQQGKMLNNSRYDAPDGGRETSRRPSLSYQPQSQTQQVSFWNFLAKICQTSNKLLE